MLRLPGHFALCWWVWSHKNAQARTYAWHAHTTLAQAHAQLQLGKCQPANHRMSLVHLWILAFCVPRKTERRMSFFLLLFMTSTAGQAPGSSGIPVSPPGWLGACLDSERNTTDLTGCRQNRFGIRFWLVGEFTTHLTNLILVVGLGWGYGMLTHGRMARSFGGSWDATSIASLLQGGKTIQDARVETQALTANQSRRGMATWSALRDASDASLQSNHPPNQTSAQVKYRFFRLPWTAHLPETEARHATLGSPLGSKSQARTPGEHSNPTTKIGFLKWVVNSPNPAKIGESRKTALSTARGRCQDLLRALQEEAPGPVWAAAPACAALAQSEGGTQEHQHLPWFGHLHTEDRA